MCLQTKNESLFKENFWENAVERPEHWDTDTDTDTDTDDRDLEKYLC